MRAIPVALLVSLAAFAQGPAELTLAGIVALSRGQYTTAVYFLKRAVDLDPRHPAAWTELGRAYFSLDQTDAAIDAHLKQIDVNPRCPGVYGNLGMAFLKAGKRGQAIEAFSQQVEVDPGNFAAHAALGDLYYDERKYLVALAELEKAAAIRPEDVPGRISLGGAYLGAGQTEKGLAILDKVVQDTPSVATWNGVAFRLANHKVKLEKARQYAQSAVTAQETALRNADLGHVTAVSLRMVVQLANCWDTLGWVYLQEGDTEKAIRYLKAAWAVNPLPETQRQLEGLVAGNHAIAHTFQAGKLLAEKTRAEFTSVEESGPPNTEVRFIRGDEKLRQFAGVVQAAVPAGFFPDATPTRLIRRVALTCPGQDGECGIELLTAAAAVTAEVNSIPPDTHITVEPGEVFRAGNGVSAPVPLYRIEPEFTEEARSAGVQGTILLYMEVDTTGRTRNVKVLRGLGYGLDERAVEAVNKWRFKPGTKDGQPVNVAAKIEVNFRLMRGPRRY